MVSVETGITVLTQLFVVIITVFLLLVEIEIFIDWLKEIVNKKKQ